MVTAFISENLHESHARTETITWTGSAFFNSLNHSTFHIS